MTMIGKDGDDDCLVGSSQKFCGINKSFSFVKSLKKKTEIAYRLFRI